jgi:NAD(P)-dependent dehydrogenase (short-subunit alcohol dehydrogenase family)
MTKPVCVVSGAAGNLGEAVVNTLKEHFSVEALVRKEKISLNVVNYHQLDLTDEAAVNTFILQLTQIQKIKAAALIAGGFTTGDLATTSYTELEKMLALNFKTAYSLIRPLYQHMKANGGGNIIVVGAKSGQHLETGGFALAYSLSKAMLFNLAEVLNANRHVSKVTVHVIVPGTIDTPDNRSAMPDADVSKWVKPETLAAKILSLCLSEYNADEKTIHPFY